MFDGDSVRVPVLPADQRVDRNDVVLAVIPGLLVLGGVVGLVSALSVAVALGLGSIAATVPMGYVLVFDPPRPA
jgi:hypothetical protein